MYSARITRNNPTAFIILIDQSGSMEEKMQYGNETTTKAEVVAQVTNRLITEIIYRCRREDGIMDYFDIAAIGYSGDRSTMLLGTRENFIKPSSLIRQDCRKRHITHERKLPDGTFRIIEERLRYWIEPRSEGNTPMRSALEQAYLLAARWCRRSCNADSYPPTIFNITDGEATDSDHESLLAIADEIKSLTTEDGNALLFNINISARNGSTPVLFPGSEEELPETKYARLLYNMSSVMPPAYNDSIAELKPGSKPPFRGMSLNTSAASLISMMNIGSRSINRML